MATNNFLADSMVLYLDGKLQKVAADDLVQLSGDFQTGNLTVDNQANLKDLATSGNISVTGTLGVTGASTLTGVVTMGSDASVAGNLTVSGNETVGGTLGVTGATTLSSTLAVTGASTLTGAVDMISDADVGGNLTVDGDIYTSGTLSVTGVSTLTGPVSMLASATIANDLTVSHDATVTGNLTVSGTSAFTGRAAFTGDVAITGDLAVNGDIVAVAQSNTLVSDAFIDLGFGNDSAAAVTTGFSATIKKADGFAPLTIVSFNNAAHKATASATVTTLAAGDIIEIKSTTDGKNDGLFVVDSVSGADIVLKNTLTVAAPFHQTSVANMSNQNASAYKVDLAVLAFSNGSLTDSNSNTIPAGTLANIYVEGANVTLFENSWVAGGETSLQKAYDGGNTIELGLLDKGNLAVSVAAGKYRSFSFDVNAASSIDVEGANLALSTTTSGNLSLTAAEKLDMDGASVDMDASGAVSIGAGAASDFTVSSGNLALDVQSGNLVLGASALVDIGGANVDIDATSAVSIGAAAASDFTVTGANLSLATLTSGNVVVNAVEKVDIDGANVDIDATSAVSIGAAAASDFTVAGANLSLQTTTSGNVVVTAAEKLDMGAANVDIDASSAVSIGAAAASDFTVAGANLALATTTSGNLSASAAQLLDLDGANVDIDASASVSIGAGADSDITLLAGNLSLEASAGDINLKAGTFSFDLGNNGPENLSGTGASVMEMAAGYLLVGTSGAISMFTSGGQGLNLAALNGQAKMEGAAGATVQSGADTSVVAVGNVSLMSSSGSSNYGVELGSSGRFGDSNGITEFAFGPQGNVTLQAFNGGTAMLTADGHMDVGSYNDSLNIFAGQAFGLHGSSDSNIYTQGSANLSVSAGGLLDLSGQNAHLYGSNEVNIQAQSGQLGIHAYNSSVGISAAQSASFSAGTDMSVSASGNATFSASDHGYVTSGGSLDLRSTSSDVALASNNGDINVSAGDQIALTADNLSASLTNGASLSLGTNLSATGSGNVSVDVGGHITLDAGTYADIFATEHAKMEVVASSGSPVEVALNAINNGAGQSAVTSKADMFKIRDESAAELFVVDAVTDSRPMINAKIDFMFTDNAGVLATVKASAKGEILCIDSSGKFAVADGDLAGSKEVAGVALYTIGSEANNFPVHTVHGVPVYVKMATAPAAGAVAYLSATAGTATTAAPGSGRVYRLGVVMSATPDIDGNYKILWKPEFVADL